MRYRQYQKVRLTTNKYIDDGIKQGDVGIVLEDYDGGNYEVEFSDEKGVTIALFAFAKEDIEPVE